MRKKGWVDYQNGNYSVRLNLDDGTKIRDNHRDDDLFLAKYPEAMDVTITSKCNMGCKMCYAGCTKDGQNADLNAPWFNKLRPYTELAIGGGNIFEHPDLEEFLMRCARKQLVPSITVNQQHFCEHFDQVREWTRKRLVYGVGVSVFNPTPELLCGLYCIPNAVLHCIVGVMTPEVLSKFAGWGKKVLLLGYKTTGRGKAYETQHDEEIRRNTKAIRASLPHLCQQFETVSFDNLALNQLNVRDFLSEREWQSFYMGDDGVNGQLTSASMYVDMVSNTFAVNSMSDERFFIRPNDTPKSMYAFLRKRCEEKSASA